MAALGSTRRVLNALEAQAEPRAEPVCGQPLATARHLVVVAGSFNPPHLAHLALLEAGLRAAGGDAGVFALSARTVDKERVSGMLLEDRLWLLCHLLDEIERPPGTALATAAANRGLYVDHAAAFYRLCPALQELTFVVGFDKIVQIFDPRYYADRDAALATLFDMAGFLVAPRDAHTAADLDRLLEEPGNRRFAGRVAALPIDPELAQVSSTVVRRRLQAGERPDGLVPETVARFIAATGCYAAPDGEGVYAARAAHLTATLERLPAASAAPPPADPAPRR